MQPDWLANLHHVVAGAILAALLTLVLRRRVRDWWLLVATAVGLTMVAEAINELLEWRFIRGAAATREAYYDVVADLGTTLVGATAGAVAGVAARRRR